MINPQEDVGEKIKSYLENRENFPSWVREHTCIGSILSGQGAVWSPLVDKPDSMTLYKGSCCLVKLSGFYLIPMDGPVQLCPCGGLKITGASPNGLIFGGSVFGALYADSPIQVMVHVSISEDPEWNRLFQNN